MTDLPKGIALTPLNDDWREAPHQVLARARQQCPAYYDDQFGRTLLLNHADVRSVLRDKDHLMDGRKANPGTFPRRFPEFIVADENSMLSLDDPDHRRLRALVSKAFTPRAVAAMRPVSRAIAERLLRRIEGDGPFEFIERFAGPYPTLVISGMLGVGERHQGDFQRWSDTSIRGFFNMLASDAEKAAAVDANAALRDLFQREIARRRRAPGSDLISGMVQAQEAGERLTDDEIVTQCNLLLVAGNVTVADHLGFLLLRLVQHPQQLQRLRQQPSLIPRAVEEALRFDPPVDASARVMGRDASYGGCPVQRGDYAYLSLMAANHDPAVFADPDRFDIERTDQAHLSFGGGAHHCLGAALARLEAAEALAAVLRRFPSLRLDAAGYQVAPTPQFRGLARLWLDPQPAAPAVGVQPGALPDVRQAVTLPMR